MAVAIESVDPTCETVEMNRVETVLRLGQIGLIVAPTIAKQLAGCVANLFRSDGLERMYQNDVRIYEQLEGRLDEFADRHCLVFVPDQVVPRKVA